jgi:aldehyde:ferredoxin oxidoreductase
MIEIIRAITGLDLNYDDLRRIASNIQDLVHSFNKREGLTRQDDCLPRRFYTEKLPKSAKVIDKNDMNTMIDEYWQIRNWTR